MVLATMLSTIMISKAKDENGQEITPEIAFEVASAAYVVFRFFLSGETETADVADFFFWNFSKPKDFKCVITPRSEQATLLVTQAASVPS
jgi:hypothetical protein